MEEIWKDVEGFEEAYQVSNLGRVRSKDRVVVTERYKNRHERGKVLKLRKDKDGYCIFNAKWRGLNRLLKVHREVARCFIANPKNYPCIDHINGIRDDNRVENLRWCTVKMNANYELASKNRYKSIKQSYINNPDLRKLRADTFGKSGTKKIEVFKFGESIGIFDSQNAAATYLKINPITLSAYINGRIKNKYGLTFKILQR